MTENLSVRQAGAESSERWAQFYTFEILAEQKIKNNLNN
jgi:hypothetical protein